MCTWFAAVQLLLQVDKSWLPFQLQHVFLLLQPDHIVGIAHDGPGESGISSDRPAKNLRAASATMLIKNAILAANEAPMNSKPARMVE